MDKIEEIKAIEAKFNILNKTKAILIAIIAGLVFFIFVQSCEHDNLMRDKKLLISTYQDTLTKFKTKDGNNAAKINLLEGTNTKLLLSLTNVSQDIKDLQDAVKANKNLIKSVGSSVTDFVSNTTFTSETTPVVTGTTMKHDTIFANYESSNKDTLWIKYHIKASLDSISLNLKVKNQYDVVIGSEKVNLFKRKPIVEVINRNPYTDTQSLRAFRVTDNSVKSRLEIGIQAGYGITFKGLGPYLGIGLNFKLL